jgi:O-antigen/teichoic acid export membrane protein
VRALVEQERDHRTAGKTVALNAVVAYVRLLAVGICGLISGRWLLSALGSEQYGLLNVITVMLLIVSVISAVLSSSASRSIALASGATPKDVASWVTAALCLQLVVVAILIPAGLIAGPWLLSNALNIPGSLVPLAKATFNIYLFSSAMVIVASPFLGVLAVYQRQVELAVWAVFQAVSSLVLVFYMNGNNLGGGLEFFAWSSLAITVLVQCCIVCRAGTLLPQCKPKWSARIDVAKCVHMVRFASWTMFGWVGVLCRDQGAALLVNVTNGLQGSAAYAIAFQASSQTNQVAGAIQAVAEPHIARLEGERRREAIVEIANRSSKYGAAFASIVALPVIFHSDFILRLWLINPPHYAAVLVPYLLVAVVIDKLTTGHSMAINANGRIAAYQVTVGLGLVGTLPMGWVLLNTNLGIQGLGMAVLAGMVANMIGRIAWARYILNFTFQRWWNDVALPVGLVILTSFFVLTILSNRIGGTTVATVAEIAIAMLVSALALYLLAEPSERQLVASLFQYRKSSRTCA